MISSQFFILVLTIMGAVCVSARPPSTEGLRCNHLNMQSCHWLKDVSKDNATTRLESHQDDNRTLDNTPLDNKMLVNTTLDNRTLDNTPLDNKMLVNTPLDNKMLDNTPLDNKMLDNTPLNNTLDNRTLDNNTLDIMSAYNDFTSHGASTFGRTRTECVLSTCLTTNLGSALQGGDEKAGSSTSDPHGPGKK